MGGSPHDDRPDHGFPVAGETLDGDVDLDGSADDRDSAGAAITSDHDSAGAEIPPDRELTVIEMMNGPGRPDERTRRTVLWAALAFASALLALTGAVILLSGVNLLEIVALVVLAAIIYGLIGALRYKGADPMAQFDPPPIPKRRLGRRRR